MSRLHRLALASALVLAAGSALAYEPELGFEYAPASPIALGAADAAPSAPVWEPEIVGLGADAYAAGHVAQETVDPIALLEPGFGPSPHLVASAPARPAATSAVSTGSGAANGQLAQNCACK